jgi:hypothetical protein
MIMRPTAPALDPRVLATNLHVHAQGRAREHHPITSSQPRSRLGQPSTAGQAELDRWVERVITASSIEEVLTD